MFLKCIYYLKLILIVALTTIFFSSVEIAPDRPLFFIILAFVLICSIHKLWRSALHDETILKKRKNKLQQQDVPLRVNSTNRAA